MVAELLGRDAVNAVLADAGATSSTFGRKYSDLAAARALGGSHRCTRPRPCRADVRRRHRRRSPGRSWTAWMTAMLGRQHDRQLTAHVPDGRAVRIEVRVGRRHPPRRRVRRRAGTGRAGGGGVHAWIRAPRPPRRRSSRSAPWPSTCTSVRSSRRRRRPSAGNDRARVRACAGSEPRCQSSAPPLSARCGRPTRDSTLAPKLRTSCLTWPARWRAEATTVPGATPPFGGRPLRRGRSTKALSASHPGNGSSSASSPSGSAVPISAAQRRSTAEQRPAAPARHALEDTCCQSIRPPRATTSTSTRRPTRRAPSRPPLMHRWTKVSTGSRVATRTFGASSTVSARSKSGAMSQPDPRRVRAQRHQIPVQVDGGGAPDDRDLRHAVVEEALPVGRVLGEPGVEQGLQRAGEVVPPHQHVDVGELAPARLAVPHGAEHRTLHDEERLTEGGRDRGEGVVGHELLTGGGEARRRQASRDGCGERDAGIVEALVEHTDHTVDAGGIEQSVEVDAVDQAGDALGRRAGVDDGRAGRARRRRIGRGRSPRRTRVDHPLVAACSPAASLASAGATDGSNGGPHGIVAA